MIAAIDPDAPAATPAPSPSAAPVYQLRLPSFEGPLDVLLRLVEREQLPIGDVSLVVVTDQFLAHLAALDGADTDLAAGFASVAGRLLVLKSRALLPRSAVPADEPDPDDLVRQLAEYRLMRDAARLFAERAGNGSESFPRAGGISQPEALPPRLAAHQPAMLVRALRRRLTLLAPPTVPAPLRPVVTLQEMLGRIRGALRPGRPVALRDLVATRDREHLLVGFLAVLVLLRRRLADAAQAEPFGEILVTDARVRPADRRLAP